MSAALKGATRQGRGQEGIEEALGVGPRLLRSSAFKSF